jgi:hypothetical protein
VSTALARRPDRLPARRIAGSATRLGLTRPIDPRMTAPVRTAMPLGEAGYAAGSNVNPWVNWDPFEKVPQLQWPEAIGVYLDMDNDDSRVTSLLESISLPVLSTKWRIDPNGARPEVVEHVSKCLNVPVLGQDNVDNAGRSRGRFSWIEHLRYVASPVPQFGHAIFEQVYRREADDRVVIRKLGPRPQWTIQSFNVALDGGLDSITQTAPASTKRNLYGLAPLDLSINRLVVYTRNMRPGFWAGRSILRSGFKHWLLKNELLKIEVAVARRNGMGVPVGTASRNNDPAEVEAMRKIAAGFRGGLHSGVGLAAGQTLSLLGVQGNLPDIRQAIEYHDKAIALAGLIHFMNLDKGGSYALANVQEKPYTQALNATAQSYAEVGQAHLVEDLVDVAFGTEERCPLLTFSPIGSDMALSSLKMLVEAGLLVPDMRVERALRAALDLPAKPDPDDPDAERPAGEPAPAQTGPPQTSGPPAEEDPNATDQEAQ